MTTKSTYPLLDTDRRMAYDGEGIELGYLTLAEAAKLGRAEYDAESDTITVER